MKLNIAPVSQRNELWKDTKLGTSTVTTIGQAGCLLVCHSMMLSYYGHDFHPDDLNEFYKNRKVFDNATYINYWAAANCFEDMKADEFVDCYNIPAPLDKIDAYLSKGMPVIAMVDFSPVEGVQTHFVLIVGKDNDYLINDPWTGETYFFTAKYGDPSTKIFGLRLYSGVVPTGGDTLEGLNAKITELYKQISDANQGMASLQTTISGLQADIADAEKRAQTLTEENRKLVFDNEKLTIRVSETENQYHESESKLQDALKALEVSQAQEISHFTSFLLVKELIRRFFHK
jgi:hypothetical protein